MTVLVLILGLILVILGAEGVVRGASSLSKKMGISPFVIGLTVVAIGTSAPELAVNLVASFEGVPDLAVGNIVGSNIANLLLILGSVAAFATLRVKYTTTWREIPFALVTIIVFFIVSNDVLFDKSPTDVLSRIDGLVLIVMAAIFTSYTFILARGSRNTLGSQKPTQVKTYSMPTSVLLVILGFASLAFGGQMVVEQATNIALSLGMSQLLVGATIVALGTATPEMATALVAIRKREADLAVGNVIGSGVYNIALILGINSVITPVKVNTYAVVDMIILFSATLLFFILLITGKHNQITRRQGILLVMCYFAYMLFIVIRG